MDGHDDDISILPDMGDETFAEDSDAPSPSTFLFRSQSAIPASTHALQTAYRDLTKRYNVLDHKYRSLSRQRRNSAQSGDRLKLASENNFPSPTFDGPNMEMGAAAMADQGSVDDHAQQSYINLLSGQLNQKISQISSLHNKLSETRLQFEEFREKHKRCSQAVNKISQLEGERGELLLQNAKLRKEVDDLRQKLAESALDTSTVRLQNFRSGVVHPDENIVHPDSNPFSAPGPNGSDVVNPSEVVYRRLEEEISYCQRSMDNLRSVVQQQNQLIQSLQGGKDVDPLVHTLQKDTVIQADELAGRYSSPTSRGSMPLSDTSVITEDGNGRTRGYSAPFKSPSSTLSRPDSVPEKTVNRTRPPSAPLPTSLRGSQPLSDPIRPPSSTSFAPSVQIQAHSAPVVGPNYSRPTSSTSNLSSVTLPSNSVSTPNVSVPSQNAQEETRPLPLDDLTDHTVTLHTQPSGEDTSKVCPVCAVNFPDLTMSEFQNHVFDCYDNTDSGEIVRTQTGLSDVSVSGIELEQQTSNRSRSRVCPVCNSDFHGDIPQAVFERHVHEHFGDQADIVDDFQVLAP